MVNERQLALDVIIQVTEYGEYLNRVLDGALDKYGYLKREQRAFVTRLSTGTIERRLTLDHVISRYSKTRLEKMDPVIRGILRLSVYQILYMDRIPDSAACNEAVILAQKNKNARLKGFVNGVLRNISRGKEEIRTALEKMARATSSVSSRSRAYSIPEWIVRMWDEAYGRERATEICANLLTVHPVTTIRVNTLKITRDDFRKLLTDTIPDIVVETDEDLPYVLYLSGYERISGLPGYEEGYFYVQDKSSMMPVALSGAKPGDTCVDVCAAPGGKTLQLIQRMEGRGRVYAGDISESKVEQIRENVDRFLSQQEKIAENTEKAHTDAACEVIVRVHDALDPDEDLVEQADVVIADLPCSGLGVIAGKPDIRYRVTEEDVHALADLQQRMLDVAARYVKIGGKLVFSTCTITPFENEGNAEGFLASHENYQLLQSRQILPICDRQDGFFIALFQRLA